MSNLHPRLSLFYEKQKRQRRQILRIEVAARDFYDVIQ